jgi:Galactose oxidase, central domain
MEPVGAAAAWAAESLVEGAAAAGIVASQPTMPVKGHWRKIHTSKALPRSSHSISVIKGKAYIFGGEERPREPVNNALHVFTLPTTLVDDVDYTTIEDAEAPPPRLGHTATVIGNRIYVFGGRGGKDMAPLDEKGRVWVFDTLARKWSYIDSMPNTPYPEARSYHASASTIHPLPNDALDDSGATAVTPHGSIFIHGGCPASGRLADVWCFDVAAATWSPFPEAPDAARGGAALALAQNRIWRYGGFDGEHELGGQVDYLRLAKTTFDDKGGKGEMAVIAETGSWEKVVAEGDNASPGKRSVAGLHPLTTGQGRNYLLCMLGEKTPSNEGHKGAGEFWDDIWSFQIQPTGMTGASLKDAARQMVGAKIAENSWARVDVSEYSKTDGKAPTPSPRGWFASTYDDDYDRMSVVLWGGIGADNERLGDGWIFTLDT